MKQGWQPRRQVADARTVGAFAQVLRSGTVFPIRDCVSGRKRRTATAGPTFHEWLAPGQIACLSSERPDCLANGDPRTD
jgi:hypothetical protein